MPAIAVVAVLVVALLVVRCCVTGSAGSETPAVDVSRDASQAEPTPVEDALNTGIEDPVAPADDDGLPPLAVLSLERLRTYVTVPEACERWGGSPEFAANGVGARVSWRVTLPLVDVATSVLEGYRAMEGVELEQDGYIDLLGHVWSCVVASDGGWSEVVLVDERAEVDDFAEEGEAGACTVTVLRVGPTGDA